MEKLMPIVPGCRAVIISSKFPQAAVNIGREVTVIRRGTESDGEGLSSGWLVAAAGLMCGYRNKDDGPIHFSKGSELFIAEHRLMRIDGGDFEAESFRESLDDLGEILKRSEAAIVRSLDPRAR